MATVNSYFNEAITYKKGEVQESTQYNYIKKTGVFDVKVVNILGMTVTNKAGENRGAKAKLELLVKGTEDLLVAELFLANDKGEPKFGDSVLRGITGLALGREGNVKWKAGTFREYGKDIEAHNIPALIDREFKVKNVLTRSIYTNADGIDKAQEKNEIKRVFNMDGQTLTEWEEGVEAKVISRESDERRLKDKYDKCTKEEWEEAKASAEDANYSASVDTEIEGDIPLVDDTLLVQEEEIIVEEPTVKEEIPVDSKEEPVQKPEDSLDSALDISIDDDLEGL